jgi:aspartate-semialdehyde dehydrogenase
MTAWRIAILGAGSLLGRELGEALRERRFPALPPRLLAAPAGETPAGERPLVEFADEPAALEPFAPEALDDVDVLFLAGSPEEARLAFRRLPPSPPFVVDLTGALADEPDAALAGLEPAPESDAPEPVARLIVPAHPAAQAQAHLLDRLAAAGRLLRATSVVLEPASQRGWLGVQELQQQSLAALSVQPLPQAIFGVQVAFNLRAALGAATDPPLAYTRSLIARQTAALRAAEPAPLALELLQAPLFHATVLALHAVYAAPEPPIERVEAALASPWLAAPAEGEYPDVLSAAGSDAIQRGPARVDPSGGVWLFATLDNLRRTAFSAVDAASAALARAHEPGAARRSRLQ